MSVGLFFDMLCAFHDERKVTSNMRFNITILQYFYYNMSSSSTDIVVIQQANGTQLEFDSVLEAEVSSVRIIHDGRHRQRYRWYIRP